MVLMETENVHWNNHICFTASSASLLQNRLHTRMTRHIVFFVFLCFVVFMSFFYFCKDEHEMIPWKLIRPHFQSIFVPTSITNKIIYHCRPLFIICTKCLFDFLKTYVNEIQTNTTSHRTQNQGNLRFGTCMVLVETVCPCSTMYLCCCLVQANQWENVRWLESKSSNIIVIKENNTYVKF